MDFDIGGGKILKNIPCQVKHNQLKCSARGKSYPDKATILHPKLFLFMEFYLLGHINVC